jgi:hypothetical protein
MIGARPGVKDEISGQLNFNFSIFSTEVDWGSSREAGEPLRGAILGIGERGLTDS